jgi:hypothetical protein
LDLEVEIHIVVFKWQAKALKWCRKQREENFGSIFIQCTVSEDVIELLIYHQPGVKPSLTLRPFGVLGYVAGHSLTYGLSSFNGI